MTPSAGASLPSMARWEKWGPAWRPSSTNVPSSISSARRSRAVSLSRACWAAILSSPPPSLICSRRARRSSARGRRRLVARTSTSAPLPLRLTLLEEGLDALLDVLGGEGDGQLRAQEVDRVGEGHVL